MGYYKVCMEEGRFRAARYKYDSGYSWFFIEHWCVVGAGWVGFCSSVERTSEPCRDCKKSVPDGLQAVFWFLKESAESDTNNEKI